MPDAPFKARLRHQARLLMIRTSRLLPSLQKRAHVLWGKRLGVSVVSFLQWVQPYTRLLIGEPPSRLPWREPRGTSLLSECFGAL